MGYERTPERAEEPEVAPAQRAWSDAQPCDGELRAVERVTGSPEPKPACGRPLRTSDVDEAFAVVGDAHVQGGGVEKELPQSGWYHWLFGVHGAQEDSTHTQ